MKAEFEVGIIGAGFGGVIAALKLRRSGRDSFVIFEKAGELGGTWRDNVYPGCACDVPSNLYSISFEPNPSWQRFYSAQSEILSYLKGTVEKHRVESRIRYDSEIIEFEFIENHGLWKLTDRNRRTTLVKMLVVAVGPFNRPKIPPFKGLESFKGRALHSARWDRGYDLRGKRVAVIGTGASSIQIVPAIAPVVDQLTVFQRTAAWVSDRMDGEVSLRTQKRFSDYPVLQQLCRGFLYWFLEFRGLMFIGNGAIHRFFEKRSLAKLDREVKDPEIRRKLTPYYKMGCKRILSSDDFYPTFDRPNVSLETDSIHKILPNGILTTTGALHQFDTIIFATGFEVAEFTTDMRVYGRGGRELFGEWKESGLEAYRGTTISGYPNLTLILGPNTGLGHNSMIHMMESQANYMMQYVEFLERAGERGFLDLKPEVQAVYNRNLQANFRNTVWASGCNSWYINADGKNTALYPGLTYTFRLETRRIKPSE